MLDVGAGLEPNHTTAEHRGILPLFLFYVFNFQFSKVERGEARNIVRILVEDCTI